MKDTIILEVKQKKNNSLKGSSDEQHSLENSYYNNIIICIIMKIKNKLNIIKILLLLVVK